MKAIRKARQFPQRGALLDIEKSQRTIEDYGKLTPMKPMQPTPGILQASLASPKKTRG